MTDPTAADPNDAASVRQAVERLRRLDREKERLFARLADGERRFRRLARSVWKVQEEERRRLARELHDGIGQTLTALKNELALARRHAGGLAPAVAERLDAAGELAHRALADTRELSRLLRPQILDDLGLEAALGWLLRTLGERSGAETRLEVRIPASVELSSEHQTLAFRMVQESLNNVEKHARAGRVDVTVEATAGDTEPALHLVVEDDGRGFAREQTGPGAAGSGLGGLRDRLALFGGGLRVDSEPGRGTRVEAKVPLAGETS